MFLSLAIQYASLSARIAPSSASSLSFPPANMPVTSLTANLDQMYMDRLNGLLSEDDFQRIYQKVRSDRAALEGRIKGLSEQTKRPVDAAEKARTLVRQFLDSAFTDREVLVSLIERVELTEEKEIIIKFRFREPEVIT